MMSRKRKKLIIIISVIVVLIILTVSLILLYLNTDMFKPNAILFSKYMGKNAENVEEIYKIIAEDEYKEKLNENKYTNETEIKVNYTENIGTSSENTENSINKLKLKISGQTDNQNKYNYQNINLLNNNKNVMKAEYIQKDNTYGIKFSDLFNQYITIENSNLKELLGNMDYSEQEINDTIELNDVNKIYEFSSEEKENLRNKYLSIIGSGFSKDNFTKKSNEIIKINDKEITTNGYILKMTKEQLNDTYIKILEELKQDEIILNKLDKLQEMMNLCKTVNSSIDTNFKEEFIKEIDNNIQEITNNNIGNEEIRIEVYESNGVTIRTSVITPDYSLKFDCLSEDNNKYAKINYENTNSENDNTEVNKKTITITKDKEKKNISYESTFGEKVKIISLEENEKIQDNDCDKNILVKYEENDSKVELNVNKKTKIVNKFNEEFDINSENSIKLNDLDKEEVQNVLNKVSEETTKKIESAFENIKIEDVNTVLKTIGFEKESKSIEETGVTRTERNRFNSQFEFLARDGLEKEDVLKTIDIIKNSLVGIQVASNTTLKLELSKNDYNEKIGETIKKYIEKMDNRQYNITVEYDEQTGLAKYVVLTIVQQEEV